MPGIEMSLTITSNRSDPSRAIASAPARADVTLKPTLLSVRDIARNSGAQASTSSTVPRFVDRLRSPSAETGATDIPGESPEHGGSLDDAETARGSSTDASSMATEAGMAAEPSVLHCRSRPALRRKFARDPRTGVSFASVFGARGRPARGRTSSALPWPRARLTPAARVASDRLMPRPITVLWLGGPDDVPAELDRR